jgi:predicted helicase
MQLHIHYDSIAQQSEYPLTRTEAGKLNWRVEKMSLSKDKTQLKYNSFLTLSGIRPEVYEYKLGNRSTLEWVHFKIKPNTRSPQTNAAASSTTRPQIAKTIPNTLSA